VCSVRHPQGQGPPVLARTHVGQHQRRSGELPRSQSGGSPERSYASQGPKQVGLGTRTPPRISPATLAKADRYPHCAERRRNARCHRLNDIRTNANNLGARASPRRRPVAAGAPIRTSMFGATPQDETTSSVNAAKATMNTRRWPQMSPKSSPGDHGLREKASA